MITSGDHSFRSRTSELQSVTCGEDTRTCVAVHLFPSTSLNARRGVPQPIGSNVAGNSAQRLPNENSEKDNVCSRVLADERSRRLGSDICVDRSADWSAAAAARRLCRPAAATARTRICVGRRLLVSSRTSLCLARWLLDAPTVSRRAMDFRAL